MRKPHKQFRKRWISILSGVDAVGDVGAANVKRVASAVGEGSVAVSLVHRALAEF